MKDRRVVVTNSNGLYYDLQVEEWVESNWNGNYQKVGHTVMVHENKLEATIARMFRGPSVIERLEGGQRGKSS